MFAIDIAQLLADKSVKAMQKRELIVEAVESGNVTVGELKACAVDDKGLGIILEAMEAVSRKNPEIASVDWLNFAGEQILSAANTVKREASRVVGNIAHVFPDDVVSAVEKLMENAGNGATVVRWASAYALGRIVCIPRYMNGDLYNVVVDLAEKEKENGVKNQYLNGLKAARRLRK